MRNNRPPMPMQAQPALDRIPATAPAHGVRGTMPEQAKQGRRPFKKGGSPKGRGCGIAKKGTRKAKVY